MDCMRIIVLEPTVWQININYHHYQKKISLYFIYYFYLKKESEKELNWIVTFTFFYISEQV